MQNLVIKIKFSRWYAGFLYGIHGVACLAVVILAIPFWAKLASIGCVVVSGCFILQKVHPVLELMHEEGKNWQLQTKARKHKGVLSDMSWVSPYAAVLLFSVPGQKRIWPVVLLRDAVDEAMLRGLALHASTQ